MIVIENGSFKKIKMNRIAYLYNLSQFM